MPIQYSMYWIKSNRAVKNKALPTNNKNSTFGKVNCLIIVEFIL